MSRAVTNHELHTINKSQLQDLLTKGMEIPIKVSSSEVKTYLLINGSVNVINWKLHSYRQLVFNRFGPTCSRLDDLFVCYNVSSITSSTRSKRAGNTKMTRQYIITSKTVKFKKNLKSLISLSAKKADLTTFLSDHLHNKPGKTCKLSMRWLLAVGFVDIW